MAPLPSEIHIFYGNIGCRDAYRETLNLVRVADDSLTHKCLPMRHSASTIVRARMACELLFEALDSDPPCLTRMLRPSHLAEHGKS